MAERPLTSADMVEGATLPAIMQEGHLKGVFPFQDDAPTVRFMFAVQVRNESPYSTKKTAKFSLLIEVMSEHSNADAALEAKYDTEWLSRMAGRHALVQLGGLRVSRVETDKDGKTLVSMSAVGPRKIIAKGVNQDYPRELRKKDSRSLNGWQFYTPSPDPRKDRSNASEQSTREASAAVPPSPSEQSGGALPLASASTAPSVGAVGQRSSQALAQAQAVPLAPNRSRSPRPLSTHALNIKDIPSTTKRPAEASSKAGNKRARVDRPQTRSALPVIAPKILPSHTATTSATALPPPAVPQATRHQGQAPAPKERIDLSSGSTPVPPPREPPVRRNLLPSPSTIHSSRDTIHTPFATQEAPDDFIDIAESSQPPPQPRPQPAPPQRLQQIPAHPPGPLNLQRLGSSSNLPPQRVPPRAPHGPVQSGLAAEVAGALEPNADRYDVAAVPQVAAPGEVVAPERMNDQPEETDGEGESQSEDQEVIRQLKRAAEKARRDLEEALAQEQAKKEKRKKRSTRSPDAGREADLDRVDREPNHTTKKGQSEACLDTATEAELAEVRRKDRLEWQRHVQGESYPEPDMIAFAEAEEMGAFDEPAAPPRRHSGGRTDSGGSTPSLPSAVPLVVVRPPSTASLGDQRRAAEEQARQRNEARLAQKQQVEQRRLADVSRLTEVFSAGPYSYSPLAQMRTGQRGVHVMGVIIKVQDPTTTAIGDISLTLVVGDPSTHTDGSDSNDRQVTIFRKAAELNNHIFEVGRAVLFRGLVISSWGGKPKGQLYSDQPGEWYVLRGNTAVFGGKTYQDRSKCSDTELDRLKALEAWWHSQGSEGSAYVPSAIAADTTITAPGHGGKTKLLSQVSAGMFFNVTVKVVRVYQNTIGPKWELYVTDGSLNPHQVRNFRNVDINIPDGGVMCLCVFDDVNPQSEALFKPDAFLHFPNVNAKWYHSRSEAELKDLELKWSDKVNNDQARRGYKDKEVFLVKSDDPRAIAIEERIVAAKILRKVQKAQEDCPAVAGPAHADPAYHLAAGVERPASPPPPVHNLSRMLSTSYTDPASHPRSPLLSIVTNSTVPNRFRTLARVRDIIPRNAKGSKPGDLAVLWCRKCNSSFANSHCGQCHDKKHERAEVRWQMMLVLEASDEEKAAKKGKGREGQEDEEEDTLVVTFEGEEAAAVLPPLPPLCSGPNEIPRLRGRIPTFTSSVQDILQGARFDGVRPRPLVDWTVESYAAGPNGMLDHLVFRVFGMTKGPASD